MNSIVFYFQVHQPFRIRRYLQSAVSHTANYFDDRKNSEVMKKVANKCYLPTNQCLYDMIKRYSGAFRISFSISGVAIEQMKLYAPEVLESFKRLVGTGAVELLAETYYHSLSALYSRREFENQVKEQVDIIKSEFGQTPTVFRNTELIYDDLIGKMVSDLGYKAILAEGCDDVLGYRSPNWVYQNTITPMKLLLKNYRLSDDIAFRFSNRGWKEFPLTTEKYASWAHQVSGCGDLINLFMDYETFGEHQWADTGIFDFLWHLPEAIFRHPDWGFKTPSEVIDLYPVRDSVHFDRPRSWADLERDITAWKGNRMQNAALEKAFSIEDKVYQKGDQEILHTWRKLLTSDHFYYMCTKWFSDGDVHAYFSPYESPYQAFLYYMSVLEDFENRYLQPKRFVPVVSFVEDDKKSKATINNVPKSQKQQDSSLGEEIKLN